jgi:hypothetical protein
VLVVVVVVVAKVILTTVPWPFAVETPMTQLGWPAVPQ